MPTFPSALLLGRTKRDNDLSLSPPFFYRGPVTLRLDQIYVLTPDQLPSDCSAAGHCLVILPALHDRAYLRKNISVITVEGADVLSIYNRVLAIFEKYDAWDDTLQDLIFHNASIEEYLKCSLAFSAAIAAALAFSFRRRAFRLSGVASTASLRGSR